MVLAVAFEDARQNQTRKDTPERGGGATQTLMFSFRDNPDLPHASINQLDPGRTSSTHFHIRDQFQVVIDGKGSLGRHNISPYSVHFSRAYTPYGPLLSVDPGLTFFVMRTRRDAGSQRLSEKHDVLKQVPDRRPWQITRQASFQSFDSGSVNADIMLQAVPDISDDRGLAAYTLRMKPNAKTRAPDPSRGDGQYVVVLKGSALHDNKEYKDWSLLFVAPEEGPLQIHAGAAGLEAFVLNFPRPQTLAALPAAGIHAATGYKKWQCLLCAFYYDEAAGMPDEGIAPGTRWEDVPETWNCPDCSASKADFQMVEVVN